MFFEEYINFKKICFLRHCGVMPVESSAIRIRVNYNIELKWALEKADK
jgi:hypothetical protein